MKRYLFIAVLLLCATPIVSATIGDYNSSLVFLMHMNGSDSGTTFTDELGHSITRNISLVPDNPTYTGVSAGGMAMSGVLAADNMTITSGFSNSQNYTVEMGT